jgi:PHD/YefM family antitoxin component YafN of YafNO toxin-antitoxin module
MKQIELTASLKWEDLLQQVKNDDVVLTREGHAVALLSDFDDDDMDLYARSDPAFLASIVRAREQAAQGKTTKHEDLKRQLGID